MNRLLLLSLLLLSQNILCMDNIINTPILKTIIQQCKTDYNDIVFSLEVEDEEIIDHVEKLTMFITSTTEMLNDIKQTVKNSNLSNEQKNIARKHLEQYLFTQFFRTLYDYKHSKLNK